MSIKNVINTGKCINEDTIFGLSTYASNACTTAIMTMHANTMANPPYPNAMMRIGTPERNVPSTGMNPKMSTNIESVNIYGNAAPPCI
jgi:hypothetical protein